MKFIWIVMLSFVVWKDQAQAIPFLAPSFCQKTFDAFNALNKQDSSNSIIETCFDSNPALYHLCLDAYGKYSADPKNAANFCEDEIAKIGKVSTTKEDKVISSIYGEMPLNQQQPLEIPETASSPQLDACQTKSFLNKYTNCDINNAPMIMSLDSISNILNFPIQGLKTLVPSEPVYGEADCKCLDQKVKTDYKLQSKGQLQVDLQRERDRVNGLIFHAIGRKFLNNYASNMEDVRFYLTNKFNVLGTSEQEASKLLCNDAQGFEQAITEACAATGVAKHISDKRTKELLGSLGDDMSSPTLDGKLKSIDDFILNFKAEKEDMATGHQQTFTRTEYDMFRNGAYKKAPEVAFISSIINNVLSSPNLKKEFDQHLQNGLNPGHALSKVVQAEKSPDVVSMLDKLAKENKDVPLYQNLKATLKTESIDDFPDLLRSTYKIAIGTHPGLKAILNDRALFQDIQEKKQSSSDKNQSVLTILESGPSLLNKHFTGRCQKMKKNLAEAVCVQNDDHIKRVQKDEINKLLVQTDGISNLPLKDLLLCQMADIEPEGVFKKLSFGMGDWLNRSDYLNRKLNPVSKQDNGFSGVYRAMNGQQRRGIKDLLPIISGFSSEERDSSPEISKEISTARQLSSLEKNNSAMRSDESALAQNINSTLNGTTESLVSEKFLAPAPLAYPTQVTESSARNESKSMRSQLKDLLADKENEKEVEKLLTNTRDDDLKELLRLKDEIARDKEKLQKLVSENDRNKVKTLEEKYNDLHMQYQKVLKQKTPEPVPVAAAIDDEPVSRGTTTGSYAAGNGDSGQTGGARYNGSSTGSTSGGQGRSVASSSRAAVTNAAPFNAVARESNRGEIIIESSGIYSVDKQNESMEINQEIISFVNRHETDAATLQKLKDRGMILKFKVIQDGLEVEKEMKVDYASMPIEAKQILDKKIAHQGIRNSQFSSIENEYLKARRAYSYSALKMILGIQAQKLK